MASALGETNILGALHASGLVSFGVFRPTPSLIGLLIGNVGSEMWRHFSISPEFFDGHSDPMNRWTMRVVGDIAKPAACEAIYPFSKPFLPFQKFAKEAMGLQSSPLGLLVHPDHGLWFAFRAALIFERTNPHFQQLEKLIQQVHKPIHPCDSCSQKPCLNACPVSAFSETGLSVDRCFDHLDRRAEPDCMAKGCAARLACPVGRSYQYEPSHMQFHMRHYRGRPV